MKIRLTHVPVLRLLGMFPGEIIEYVHKETCIGIFITAFFVIVKKMEFLRK